NIVQQYDADTGADSADEIEAEKAFGPPMQLQVGPKHPQSEHVEEDMEDTTMQEHVGGQLPDHEVLDHRNRKQRQVGERPIDLKQLCEEAKDEDSGVGDQQPLDAGRKSRCVECRGAITAAVGHEGRS